MIDDAATVAMDHCGATPLPEPRAGWLAECNGAVPTLAALNGLRERVVPTARSGSGRLIRFVAPPSGVDYEPHIFATGEVPTRADNWHDAFNALAWCDWPLAKSACNAIHASAIADQGDVTAVGRGACRDALTQFDECGVVVMSSDPKLLRLLVDRQWEQAFWQRRESVTAQTRFLVFGHATRDQLRQPFIGLCGKALYRDVAPAWMEMGLDAQLADADRWLAGWLREKARSLTPRAFSPLPLLGIPGVTPDNVHRDYYRDTRQFRPRRLSEAVVLPARLAAAFRAGSG